MLERGFLLVMVCAAQEAESYDFKSASQTPRVSLRRASISPLLEDALSVT